MVLGFVDLALGVEVDGGVWLLFGGGYVCIFVVSEVVCMVRMMFW